MPTTSIIACRKCGKEFVAENWLINKYNRLGNKAPCCSRACAAACAFDSGKHPCIKHRQCAGYESTKEYNAWMSMKFRCYNPKNKRYHRYGGRGITVCHQWLDSFTQFLNDVGLAPSPQHTLGRIDNDGNYETGNIEWQLPKPQANNRSTSRLITAFNKTQTLQQWADERKLSGGTIKTRIDRYGWSAERAVSEPVMMLRRRK
jgi:hypothetical protein